MFSNTKVWRRIQAYDEKNIENVKQIREELKNAFITTPELNRVPSSFPKPVDSSFGLLFQQQEPSSQPTNSGDLNPHIDAFARHIQAEKLKEQQEQALRLAEIKQLESVRPKPSPSLVEAAPSQDIQQIWLKATLQRLHQRELRTKDVQNLDKSNKAVKSVKLHLSMLTNTRKDIKFRIDGSASEIGPRALMEYVTNKAPKQLEPTMQVIADRIVQCSTANLAVDALMRGETNYGLAYLTLILCIVRPAFVDILLGALESACPFIQPGLKDYIEQTAQKENWSKEVRKKKLGYKDVDEGDDEYIFRMQGLVAFYGAMLAMPVSLLSKYVELVSGHHAATSVTAHPLGGLGQAWRWLARTLNGQKWRWTRFLVHSFLCMAGRDLSLILGKQITKLISVMQSASFTEACEKSAAHPNDDDRIKAFERFLSQSMQEMAKDGALVGPGRLDDVDGEQKWVDPRNLPDGNIVNTG